MSATPQTLLTVDIRDEQSVVATRQRARQIAGLLGFGVQEQTNFATAVSEVARNAFRYAGGGRTEFALQNADGGPLLLVRVRDAGPGIPHLQQILDGQYRSQTGMGIGLIGSRKLCDRFEIETASAGGGRGTTVTLGKRLPGSAPVMPQDLARLSAELAQQPSPSPLQEVLQQNRELLVTIDELQRRQAEVDRLNAELSETNRGVLALYAELDDKAVALQSASELKSRFLSDMSHELRTPLNAMISISGLLLDRVDGELTSEQEKQVSLIRRSAESLREMVNDLLDLAKIEAGKTEVHPSEFHTADLFAAIRGMFRPLFESDTRVALFIDDDHASDALPPLHTDEQKVAQILRNFVSNAMKFTERGHVQLRVRDNGDATVTFAVSDTGIGIAPADQDRIFQHYEQVDSSVQRRVRGTGLGLPLARKLARLLGGDVSLRSAVGGGSTFCLTIPIQCPTATGGDGGSTDHLETESASHG